MEFTTDSLFPIYLKDPKSLQDLIKNLKVEVVEKTDDFLELDLINFPVSIANALRRILLSEMPSIAFDSVLFKSNDGIMVEEFLAHRIGQIPVKISPEKINFNDRLIYELEIENKSEYVIDVLSDYLKFVGVEKELKDVKEQNVDEEKFLAPSTFLGELIFDEIENFLEKKIVITKLGAGQSLKFRAFATKNIGDVHAKWSPVCPATYIYHPYVEIIEEISGEDAKEFQKLFKKGVIGIKEVNGKNVAFVENERLDSGSREALQVDKFKNKVKIGKRSDKFIFTIESVSEDPMVLFKKAVSILYKKAEILKEECEKKLEI